MVTPGPGWLACGVEDLPDRTAWLTPAEAARAAALRYPKRRREYLLRRLAAKLAIAHAHASSPSDPYLSEPYPSEPYPSEPYPSEPYPSEPGSQPLHRRSTAARPPGGCPFDVSVLARIEVANASDGSPYALVDGRAAGMSVSLTDRDGRAVCLLTRDIRPSPDAIGPPAGIGVGVDLELVEPRSVGFIRDFLTDAACRRVLAHPPGPERALAANLVWSATESALKVLREGLRRDTRDVEVEAGPAGADGWGALRMRVDDLALPGWWRRDGRFVLTVATPVPTPPPVLLSQA